MAGAGLVQALDHLAPQLKTYGPVTGFDQSFATGLRFEQIG